MKLILASLLVIGLIPLAYAQLVPPLDLELIAHQVFDEVNEERVDASLQPLTWNEQIADVAEGHSTDQATRNYLAHNSPEGTSPAMRGSNAGFVHCGDSEMIAAFEGFGSLVADYKTKAQNLNLKIRQFNKDYQAFKNFGNGDYIQYQTIVDKHKKIKSEYDSLKSLRQSLEDKRSMINTSIQDGKIIKGFSENLAQVSSTHVFIADVTVEGWMNSPEHKAIMLDEFVHSSGVGAVLDGTNVIITQNFC